MTSVAFTDPDLARFWFSVIDTHQYFQVSIASLLVYDICEFLLFGLEGTQVILSQLQNRHYLRSRGMYLLLSNLTEHYSFIVLLGQILLGM